MKIAILGATGMIGNHCARAAVARGHEVRVVHRASSDLRPLADLACEKFVADVERPETLRAAFTGVDALIHTAGYYPSAVPGPWREEVDRGVRQLRATFDACRGLPLTKIVFVGSVVALPPHPQGLPATESLEFPPEPADPTPYLQVKAALDRCAREEAKRGLPVVVGIPGMCLGEYDKGPTTGRLIVEIANRSLPGYVRGRRNVVYTGDAGRGMVLACERGRIGERYLITGTNIEIDDLVKRIAEIAGVRPPRIGISAPLARRLAKLLEWRWSTFGGEPPKLTSTAIAVSSGQFLDGGKAREELGYEPEVPLDEAIRRALGWFRAAGYVPARVAA